jgi:beta-lactamase regulating signal transducer with metallopeptidase domain
MSEYWISAEWLQRMAGSLLHFVWQGALLAFLAALLLRLLARRQALLRYTVAVMFLGLMLLAPCVTFLFYPETGAAALRLLRLFGTSIGDAALMSGVDSVAQWTYWIVLAWATGVTACSIRLLTGWMLSIRLVNSAKIIVPASVEQLMNRAKAALLARQQSARLLIGERVTGPVVFGWLRPVVLLPASAVTGLTEEQLLAILAHELAHVRRQDFLVNALQRVVESVLFYHPAVWWLSARIRTEREHCCDDLAVTVCGDRFAYAEALMELERLRPVTPAFAVPAGGRLVDRVRRLLGIESVNRDWQPATAALLLVALCAAAGLWQGETIAAPRITVLPPAAPVLEIAGPAELAPAAPIETALSALAAIATGQPQQPAADRRWATTWAMTLSREAAGDPRDANYDFQCCNDQTIRMFMRSSIGGKSVRIRLSNAFGTAPLFLGKVYIALHDRGSEILPGSSRPLLFGGKTAVEIPVGETITSDPAELEIPALANLAISIYAPNETGTVTSGWGQRAGYVVTGDYANAQSLTGAKLMRPRLWVSSVEVLPAEITKVVIIVEGSDLRSSTDVDRNWPVLLSARLQGSNATRNVAIVTSDDLYGLLKSATATDILSAFDHVVSSQGSVRKLLFCPDLALVYASVDTSISVGSWMNIGNRDLAPKDRMVRFLQQVVDQAKTHGVGTIGCTIAPPEKEVTGSLRNTSTTFESLRVAVNEWIRTSNAFEGIIDIDAVIRNPAQPSVASPSFLENIPFTSRIRLADRGHKAIADAIDLNLFSR